MKETPKRIITGTSSLKEQKLGSGGSVTPPVPTPIYSRKQVSYLKTT
jgi:hypothetical protein